MKWVLTLNLLIKAVALVFFSSAHLLLSTGASATSLELGPEECDRDSVETLQLVSSSQLLLAIESALTEENHLVIRCVVVRDDQEDGPTKLVRSAPNLSITFNKVQFDQGLLIEFTSLNNLRFEDVTIGRRGLRIVESSLASLNIQQSEINGPLILIGNTVNRGILIGKPTYTPDTTSTDTYLNAELAIVQNSIGSSIELGNLSYSTQRDLPFLFGNTVHNILIEDSAFQTDSNPENERTDTFDILSNRILGGIFLRDVSVDAILRADNAPIQKLHVERSSVLGIDALAQDIRDVFIFDRRLSSTSHIHSLFFTESQLGSFNLYNVKVDNFSCEGCVVEGAFFVATNLGEANFRFMSVSGPTVLSRPEISGELVDVTHDSLDFSGTNSPMLVIENIHSIDADTQWRGSKFQDLVFAGDIQNPAGIIAHWTGSSTDPSLYSMISRYYLSRGDFRSSNRVLAELRRNEVLNSSDNFFLRWSGYLIGLTVGFGYEYRRLVYIAFFVFVFSSLIVTFKSKSSNISKMNKKGRFGHGMAYTLNVILPGVKLGNQYNYSYEDQFSRNWFFVVNLYGYFVLGIILADVGNAF